ncbi:unnamed protein product, partial [Ectocarpus sp. 13 AM-2016]
MRQIEEFGQAPAQLFKSPHPRRLSIAEAEVVRPLASPVPGYPRESVSRGAVLVVTDLLPWAERLVTVDTRRAIGFHGWRTLPPERSPPFRLRAEAPTSSPIPVHTRGEGWNRRIGEGVGGGVGLGSHLFAVLAESYLLFSGGHWDSSFRATALDTGRLVVSIARHRDVVTSLSLAEGGKGCRRLVTASRDTTLMVWRVEDTAGERAPPVSPSSLLHVLYGHDTPVTCVCARADLDAIVSSGEDGTVVVHTLWGGEYVRTIIP